MKYKIELNKTHKQQRYQLRESNWKIATPAAHFIGMFMPCSFFQACPGWSSWGSWADCSVTCGGGVRSHTRVCLVNGEPAKGCGGSSVDYSICSTAVSTADFTFFQRLWNHGFQLRIVKKFARPSLLPKLQVFAIFGTFLVSQDTVCRFATAIVRVFVHRKCSLYLVMKKYVIYDFPKLLVWKKYDKQNFPPNAEIFWHAFPHCLHRHVQHGVSGTIGDAAAPLVVEEPDCVQGLAWMGTLGQLDARGLLCSPRHAPRRL